MSRSREDQDQSAALEGRYANYFKVGHNAFEVVLDFGQLYNSGQEARLHTRIITSPFHAKELISVLVEALEGYERHERTPQ